MHHNISQGAILTINDPVEIVSYLHCRLDIQLPDKHLKIKILQLKPAAFCLILQKNPS